MLVIMCTCTCVCVSKWIYVLVCGCMHTAVRVGFTLLDWDYLDFRLDILLELSVV